jgi:hypothetical protein
MAMRKKRLSFWEALNRLDESHSRFKPIFILSLMMLFVAAGIAQLPPRFLGTAIAIGLAQAFMGVFASIAAAALLEIFSGIRALWQKDESQGLFRELFDIPEESGKVAIVLSRFSTRHLPSNQTSESVGSVDILEEGNVQKRIREVNDQVYASADVKAVADLVLTFSGLGLPIPILEPDDRIIERLTEDSLPYSTYIALGLQSNLLTMQVGSSENLFRIFDQLTDEPKLKVARRSPNGTLSHERSESYSSDRTTHDHVLLARTRLPEGQTLIIVGGLEAKGTEKVGAFIRKHWRDKMLSWCDSFGTSLSGHCFAVVAHVSFKGSDFRPIEVVVV